MIIRSIVNASINGYGTKIRALCVVSSYRGKVEMDKRSTRFFSREKREEKMFAGSFNLPFLSNINFPHENLPVGY